MSRNVWLKFDEWELINKELSDQKYHSFQLSQKQVDAWRNDIKRYSGCEDRKFERVGIYPEVNQVKSAKALNILCREDWRSQDMSRVMVNSYAFIGFILSYCEDVNMNTTLDEWEKIRDEMNHVIKNSDKRIWFDNELIDLYSSVVMH